MRNAGFSREAFLSRERQEGRWLCWGQGCRGPGTGQLDRARRGCQCWLRRQAACLACVVGVEELWTCEARRGWTCFQERGVGRGLEAAHWLHMSPWGGQSDGNEVTDQKRDSSGTQSLARGGSEGRAMKRGNVAVGLSGQSRKSTYSECCQGTRSGPPSPHHCTHGPSASKLPKAGAAAPRVPSCLPGDGPGALEWWPWVTQHGPEDHSGGKRCL